MRCLIIIKTKTIVGNEEDIKRQKAYRDDKKIVHDSTDMGNVYLLEIYIEEKTTISSADVCNLNSHYF